MTVSLSREIKTKEKKQFPSNNPDYKTRHQKKQKLN